MTPRPGILLALTLLAACAAPARDARTAARDSTAVARAPATGPAHAPALLAMADTAIPEGPMGGSVRRGRALLTATRDSLPAHVGSLLRCTSCHLDEGRRAWAAPLVGVYARFPQVRARTGTVGLIEERVNDCFQRSLNGTAIDWRSREMRDIVAYLAWLSRGVAPPGKVEGQGVATLPVLAGDSARGAAVYAAQCARCHGDGTAPAAAPPLWGAHSFNIAASFARSGPLAGFVRRNMPFDRPGTLSDQEATDVAAFVVRHPRPDFAGKENDWPNGDAPADVPYATRGKGAASRQQGP